MDGENVIRLAMINDHDLFSTGICKLLEGYGFQIVFEAENGKLAIEKMEGCENVPDILIVDIHIPVKDGFEATKTLFEKYPELKIIALSINDEKRDVEQMLQCGVQGYVLKGADPDELKKAIEIVYDGGKYFSQGVSELALEYFSGYKN